MEPERWALVDQLLQSSLSLSPADREAYLRSRCISDDELYREVESLLEAHDNATSFLESTAIEVEARAVATTTARFEVGTRIGPYRVISRLGTGGMSEVYRARDTTLERDVAIKVLTGDFADDRERLQRVRQEAKAASALNHPNILTIHEIGEDQGTSFIVAEYIEGRTLRACISDTGMPLATALDVALQIASALSAAHEAGIVHRDIKPENVIVRPDGLVKVLDFGLARPRHTLANNESERRAIAGTPTYMSPEQLSDQEVDARTDIFSLGVVVYEMISGRVPLPGAHAIDTHGTSSSLLHEIIARMLATDRNERYSSADQVHAALTQVRDRLAHRRPRPVTVSALVVFSAVIIAIVGTRFARSTPASPPPMAKLTPITSNNRAVAAAISPDGARVAYVTQEVDGAVVWLRELATGRDAVITPASPTDYVGLTFSRDRRVLYYVARDATNPIYALYQTSPPGENPKRVTSGFISEVAFSPDGKRLAFVRGRPPGDYVLMVANADGSSERPLLTRRMGRDTIGQHLSWSPDGRTIVITAGDASHPPYATLIAVNVNDGTAKPIPVRAGQLFRSLTWTTDGGGIVLSALDRALDSGYQLWHLTYPDGTQTKITNDLQSYQGISLAADSSAFVTLQDHAGASVWTARREDRFQGRRIAATTGNDDGQYGLAWTPDGRIVYTSTVADATDLLIMDADGGNRRALTRGGKRNMLPSVSADGRYLVYVSNRSGPYGIWRMSLSGGDVKYLAAADGSRPHVSPDGKWVLYHRILGNNPPTLWKVSIDGGVPERFTDRHSRNPVVSPNGTLVAYTYLGPDSRRPHTAIVPVDGGPPIMTIDMPALQVRWTPDGNALSFVKSDRGVSNIWKTPLDGGPSVPVTAFDAEQIYQFDWSRDGRLVVSRGTTSRDVVMISGFR
jgi:eukaryotic-like serine/threonine-protein kinase